jgi:Domain of unknown function (DUF4861)
MVGSRASTSLFAALLLAAGPLQVAQAQDDKASERPRRAFARHVPERFDDVAWENDRIAFRVYGPALEDHQQTGSGIDVWSKSIRGLVIDRWYRSTNYHKDNGEGLDFYDVGQGRGCGGLGVWNGKSLDVSRVWASHKILESGPDRASIELTYAPWTSGDRKVWETRRITLEAGSNLNRVVSTIDSDKPDELMIGVGISRRDGDAAVKDKARGLLSTREPKPGPTGTIGCGVLVDPAILVDFVETKGDRLVLIKVKPGKPFVYYAGAGWSKSGDFPTAESWERYLREYPTRFAAD